MNSYNKQRSMSNQGMRKQVTLAPKLMTIENEFHRTKDALMGEIKRLRGEVGTLAKRYNNAKREFEDLVKRVRSQPPPPIPRRDEETEKRKEEQRKRWTEHLQKESEEEEKKQIEEESEEEENREDSNGQSEEEGNEEDESEDDSDIDMQDTQPPMKANSADNNLSPEQTPPDQKLQKLHDIESDTPMTDSTDKTLLENGSNQVEEAAKEKKKEAEKVTLKVGEKWAEERRKMETYEKGEEFRERAKNWACAMEMVGREDEAIDVGWFRSKASVVLREWKAQNPGTKLTLIDAWCYGWMYGKLRLKITADSLVLEEKLG